jgi:hypothetical protein
MRRIWPTTGEADTMTRLRTLTLAALLLLGLAFPAHAVVPTCTGNITSVYWVVTDTNQSTQVYDPNRGYVANTDATYATWLAGIGACPVSGGSFTSAVNSGGLVQFPVASGANMVTGQVWQVYGTDGGVYDGKWTVTVSGNNVTLQGSTYTVPVTGGAFYGPQVTATNAGLMVNINATNAQNLNQATYYAAPNQFTRAAAAAITAGTYNSGTGLVTLTVSSPNKQYFYPGQTVAVGGATGTGSFASINGSFATTPAPNGTTTITYTIATGLTMTITGANVEANGLPLTNPLPLVTIIIDNDGAGIYLPQENLIGSMPIGVPFWIINDSTSTQGLPIGYFDTVTALPAFLSGGSTLPPGMGAQLEFKTDLTPNGTIVVISLAPQNILPTPGGGTGTGAATNNQIPVGLGTTNGPADWESVVGDCVASHGTPPGGNVTWTCTKLNGVSPGTLFPLNAAPAGTLTGTTLNSTVVTSSLTSVGTLGTGVWQGTVVGATYGGTGVNNGSKTITLGASLITTGAGGPTLAFPATAQTYTFPAAADTLAALGTVETWTGAQTFATGKLIINGGTATAGIATVTAGGVVSSVAVVPVANGGSNCSTASGTCLDNITGFSSTGFLKRTGAGTYTFTTDPSDVTSVFGRTGAVVATSGDYTFAQIGSPPTTLAGYGITSPLPYAQGGTAASTSWTQGSVIFGGASAFAQDNANFYYDATNHRLCLGLTGCGFTLTIQGVDGTNAYVIRSSGGNSAFMMRSSASGAGVFDMTNAAGTLNTELRGDSTISYFGGSDGNGRLAVGTTTDPGAGGLQLNGQQFMPNITTTSVAQTGTVCWTTGTGKFTVDTTLACLASIRAAKNLTGSLLPSDALSMVEKMQPISFRYKEGFGDGGKYEQFGFVAEDIAAIDERMAGRDFDGTLHGVRYQELTAVLAGAIQELKADNDNIRAANDNLRACMESWKCRLLGWR